ncbi:hypothetical protein CEXT_551581 [Caerostris extrusa]|uniref:Uncharacterized protein n=1 Tax=Caerostris extrusa TaxID=172846 RepID=A0AAV4SUK8_CAEEX|nr:hypothetical protein CEXT_551581 [Caerostris extrusa]
MNPKARALATLPSGPLTDFLNGLIHSTSLLRCLCGTQLRIHCSKFPTEREAIPPSVLNHRLIFPTFSSISLTKWKRIFPSGCRSASGCRGILSGPILKAP